MTELTTIDTNNYAEMAKAMGMANEAANTKKQGMFLARLRINHSAILGAEASWLRQVHTSWRFQMDLLTTLSLPLSVHSCNASCTRSL